MHLAKATIVVLLLIATLHTNASEPLYTEGYAVIKKGKPIDTSIHQTVRFDPKMCGPTVLDALGYVLEGTGYVLAPPAESDPRIRELLDQPVPSFMSEGGLYELSYLLKSIAGNGWTLKEDPIRRYVTFVVAKKQRNSFITVK